MTSRHDGMDLGYGDENSGEDGGRGYYFPDGNASIEEAHRAIHSLRTEPPDKQADGHFLH